MDRSEVRKISEGLFCGEVIVDSPLDRFLGSGGNPGDLFKDCVVIKSSWSTRTALAVVGASDGPSGEEERLFVKEYPFRSLLHSFRPLFFEHRAQTTWSVSLYLRDFGISVPKPLGYLVRRRGPFSLGGLFFSEVISDCRSLGRLARNKDELHKRLGSHGVMEVLAESIAAMHDAGVIHGDLKWSNILLQERADRIWIVDFDSTRRFGRSPGLGRTARDLARFVLDALEVGVNADVVDRFLDEYTRRRNLNRKHMDQFVEKALRSFMKKRRYGESGK